MRNDLTDITLIVDRSGSMNSIRADAEGGINAFIEEQKKLPNEATFSLVQFDDVYDFVQVGVPIKEAKPYVLTPRNGTALYDALGRTISETGIRLAKMPEEQRPGLVICVIVTDGGENASKEYRDPAVIKKMIQHQTDVYKWKFIYLGANQDAFLVGDSLGINSNQVANFTSNNVAQVYASSSAKIGVLRSASFSGEETNFSYSSEERDDLTKQ